MNEKIEEIAQRIYRSFLSEQPTPDGWLPIEAWTDGKQVVVLGTPDDDENLPEEQWHDCDAMGCSSVGNHVLGIYEL